MRVDCADDTLRAGASSPRDVRAWDGPALTVLTMTLALLLVGCDAAKPQAATARVMTAPATIPSTQASDRRMPAPTTIAEAIARFEIDPRLTLCHVWETKDGSLAGFVEYPEHRTLLGTWLKRDVSKVKLLPEESTTPSRHGVVTADHAILREDPIDRAGDRDNVSDLTRGERVLILDRHREGASLVHSSDGYLGWVDSDAVRPLLNIELQDKDSFAVRSGERAAAEASGAIEAAKTFLGTPYVWGGKTKEGIDCSGLVQVSFARHGILLPRDADQQSNVGRLVATRWFKEALLPGDLLFFISPRRGNVHHVAIYMGAGKYIEAAGGTVRIRSLTEGDADYDAERARTFAWARRVID